MRGGSVCYALLCQEFVHTKSSGGVSANEGVSKECESMRGEGVYVMPCSAKNSSTLNHQGV